MQMSIDRILVTHVGSLPRGEELGALLIDDEAGLSLDKPKITKAIEQRVAYVLNKQHEAGVDIASDGEQGRVGFQTYVPQRMSGFGGASKRPATCFSFAVATSPFAAPHTTPSTSRGPSGTRT